MSISTALQLLTRFQSVTSAIAIHVVGSIAFLVGVFAYFLWCSVRLIFGLSVALAIAINTPEAIQPTVFLPAPAPIPMLTGAAIPSPQGTARILITPPPALTQQDLEALTKSQLRLMAGKEQIKGRSKMNKNNLVTAILKAKKRTNKDAPYDFASS